MIEITTQCLSTNPFSRPDDAGVVAQKVNSYFESVDKKLRESELRRAKSEERRKRKKVKNALVATVLFFLFTACATVVWIQGKQAETNRANLRASNAETKRQRQIALVQERAREEAVQANKKQIELRENADLARTKAEQNLCDVYTNRAMEAAERDDAGAAIMWFAAAAELAGEDTDRYADNLLRAKNWTSSAALPVSCLLYTSDAADE